MALAIFDLDNTLIAGDSDHAWGQFLVDQKLVDAHNFANKNDQFLIDYQESKLDISAYLRFALAPLQKYCLEELTKLHQQFMNDVIEAIVLPKAEALINEHRQLGHTLMIITATNEFVTGPIAKRLGIEHLLASQAEIKNDRYTGEPIGTPCFQEGKVTRLNQWLRETHNTLSGSYFYSDSANDIPLLKQVSNPVAVDPCPRLKKYAQENNMPIMSLR